MGKTSKGKFDKKNNFNIDLCIYIYVAFIAYIFCNQLYRNYLLMNIQLLLLMIFHVAPHLYSTNIRTIKFEFHILSPSAEKWVWIEPDFSSFYSATNVFSMRRSDLEYHLIRPFFVVVVAKNKGNFSTATVNRVSETNLNRVSVTQFTTSSSTTIFVYL